MRVLRTVVGWVFPMGGLLFVAVGVLAFEARAFGLAIVLFGVLLIALGTWNLANPLLPDERRFLELRAEVDGFIQKVRSLNAAAFEARMTDSDEAWGRYQEILGEMHASVERMGTLAGEETRTEDALPPSGVG